jgi:hypothetical protein
MIRGNNFLIHNGVVDNLGETYEKITDNDSEDMLYHYLDGGIEKVARSVAGYYACVVFKENGEVSLFRDAIAPMVWAWSDKFETAIYASTQSVLNELGKVLGEGLEGIPLLDNVHILFDDKGNEMEMTRFTPTDRMSANARKNSKKSIGKVLEQPSLPIVLGPEIKDEDGEEHYDIRNDMHLVEIISPEYIAMLKTMNDDYTIINPDGRILGAKEFLDLKLGEKISCEVKDPDGNTIDPFYYDIEAMNDKLNGTKN